MKKPVHSPSLTRPAVTSLSTGLRPLNGLRWWNQKFPGRKSH